MRRGEAERPRDAQLLQSVNLAQPYVDSKTFVDKPTNGTSNHTLADFNVIDANGVGSITEGQIVQFLEQDFVRPNLHACSFFS
jgi:alpha,alpha-trehalase